MTSSHDTTDALSVLSGPAPPPFAAAEPAPSQHQQPDFSRREFALPELLDGPCTFAEWRRGALDLARLNRLTRAEQPTLAFLERAVTRTGVSYEPLHVVDVGCGHGDGLRAIYRWARQRSLPLRLTGIDRNPYAARLARERDRAEYIPAGAIAWITADVFAWQPTHHLDLVTSSLFAHHLSDADIVRLLRWCDDTARIGWFLSDLRRSARAARIASWLTRLLRLHPSVQHDTLLSFRRALAREDWQQRLAEANITGASVEPGRGKLFLSKDRAQSPSVVIPAGNLLSSLDLDTAADRSLFGCHSRRESAFFPRPGHCR